jgi:peptidoglycan hydrolase-like protein with peptidoglycan-binding domain
MEHKHQSEKFGPIDLASIAGVQAALVNLGYDPGEIDGKDGPKTRAAVRAFQQATGIGVDGIAGPVTKRALLAALDEAAAPQTRV